jgi:hypothetical protein
MGKRLPLLTLLLVAASIAFVVLIVKELTSAPPVRASRSQPAASVAATAPPPAAPAPAPAAAQAPGGPGAYAVIASRNLFSPTRTEAPPPPPVAAAPPPVPVLPKPNLFGVVLQDGAPVAYLEDPVTKRVARYRVGDAVAGGTVKTIGSDTVMLMRPEGEVTVRLHDPTRPKPAVPTPTPTPTPLTPGARPVPPASQVTPEGRPTITTPRRPIVPGVLGRTPAQPTDAPPSQ